MLAPNLAGRQGRGVQIVLQRCADDSLPARGARFARSRKIKSPFEIAAPRDPFYGETNMRRLRTAIAELNSGRGQEHELIEEPCDNV